jgi:Glucose / Sorbosone dehydrogenase
MTNVRILLLGLLASGIALLAVVWVQSRSASVGDVLPMDVEWVESHGYASVADGRILRLTIRGDEVRSTAFVDGLADPRGVAVIDQTIYVAELGESNSGRILAYTYMNGVLSGPQVVVDNLHVVDADHGLNDLEAGPDAQLYLSVGGLDALASSDDGSIPTEPTTSRLGSVLRIDPESGDVEIYATGLRDVYGLSFDEEEQLWGVDRVGRRDAEELLEIDMGLDYGVSAIDSAGGILPANSESGGLYVHDGVAISGGCGGLTRVDLAAGGEAPEDYVVRPGCVTSIEPLPDGRFIVGTVLGNDPLEVLDLVALFDE